MPFWSGKRKTNPAERVMMCPNCHGRNLRYSARTGLVLGQPRLLCPDCGYKGFVFVEIDPNDTKENEIELEFLRENPEFLESRQLGWKLAQETLEKKWKPDQGSNSGTLREWCPFCADVEVICTICRCPPEICAEQATKGWIGELNELYEDTTPLAEVDPALYQKIVARFQQMIENHEE